MTPVGMLVAVVTKQRKNLSLKKWAQQSSAGSTHYLLIQFSDAFEKEFDCSSNNQIYARLNLCKRGICMCVYEREVGIRSKFT